MGRAASRHLASKPVWGPLCVAAWLHGAILVWAAVQTPSVVASPPRLVELALVASSEPDAQDPAPEPAMPAQKVSGHAPGASVSKPSPARTASKPKETNPRRATTNAETAKVVTSSEGAVASSLPEPHFPTDSVPGAVFAARTGGGSYGAFGVGHSALGGLGGGPPSPKRSAKLLARSAACNDLFPVNASQDAASVDVDVQVKASGRARLSRVLSRSLSSREFDRAVQLCAERLRFVPATNHRGEAIASRSVLRLKFSRLN